MPGYCKSCIIMAALDRNSIKGGAMKITTIAAVFLLIAGPAAAGLEGVTIHIDEPTAGEAFAVSVQGILHDSCWSLERHSVDVGDGVIYVNVYTLIVSGGCLTVVTPYTVDTLVTVPTPGEWLLRAVEIHVTHEGVPPRPDEVMEIPVTVRAAVGDDDTFWSAVKALFR